MTRYTAVDVADITAQEPAGPGGRVRFVRREIGASAFGINRFDLSAGFAGPPHDETASGQEEVYVFLEGSGTLTIDDEPVAVHAGMFVRVDAEASRQMTAGPDGLSFVAVGSPPGGGYTPRGPF